MVVDLAVDQDVSPWSRPSSGASPEHTHTTARSILWRNVVNDFLYLLCCQPSTLELAKREDFSTQTEIPADFVRRHGGSYSSKWASTGESGCTLTEQDTTNCNSSPSISLLFVCVFVC